MRLSLIAAVVAVVFLPAPARADISVGLKFCADLKGGKERLACYDAAVGRLASNRFDPPQEANTSRATPLRTNTTNKSSFDGSYLGLGAGRDYQSMNDLGANGFSKISGAKIGVIAGHNATFRNTLFGLESRSQYSFGKHVDEVGYGYSAMPTFPQFAGSLTCYSCTQADLDNYPGISSSPLTVAANSKSVTKYTRPWQFDLSFRSGVLIEDDWLIFVKVGGGIEKSLVSFATSSSATSCAPQYQTTQTGPQSLQFDMVGCGPFSTTNGAFASVRTYYSPVVVFGGGFERNFGSFFLRAEAEITSHLIDWGATYYSPSGSLIVGYRF